MHTTYERSQSLPWGIQHQIRLSWVIGRRPSSDANLLAIIKRTHALQANFLGMGRLRIAASHRRGKEDQPPRSIKARLRDPLCPIGEVLARHDDPRAYSRSQETHASKIAKAVKRDNPESRSPAGGTRLPIARGYPSSSRAAWVKGGAVSARSERTLDAGKHDETPWATMGRRSVPARFGLLQSQPT